MNMLWGVILTTTIAGIGGTGIGGAAGACFHKESKKMISMLLSFAGGVMLGVVCFDLITGALFPDGGEKPTSLVFVFAGIILGYASVGLLHALIDKNTRFAHSPKVTGVSFSAGKPSRHVRNENLSSLLVAGLVMAGAIALHNVPEGMIIGASFAGAGPEAALSGPGLVLAVVIALHNIPEGMAVSAPLIAGGMRRTRAVSAAALSGAPTILGAWLGYRLGIMGPAMLALSLCFASGAMLYVVFCELLPEAVLLWRSTLPAFAAFIGVLTGLFIVYH
ncbi:MAG: ZIP family metal transporter [Clostridiaceae bacterium]|nr:ZIP family metal transporter [Clostridiaceae bacterium]